MSDDDGEESGDELIRPTGPDRLSYREPRVTRTESSVKRLTRTSFSAVGAAPTKETLARAAIAIGKRRVMNIVECYDQEAAVRRESLLGSRGVEWGPIWARRDPLLYLLVTIIARDPAASPSGETQDYARCKPFSCHERWFGRLYQWWRPSHWRRIICSRCHTSICRSGGVAFDQLLGSTTGPSLRVMSRAQ